VSTPDDYWFIYLCGIIGITAMILPGISGSFLLLILGKYEYITGALKNPFEEGALVLIGIFLCGTVTGLLGFSKVLNYFMKNFRENTMAFLTGILIGSMKKVWPWKEVLESKMIRGKVRVIRDANIFPDNFTFETNMAFALIIVGFITVLFLESKSRQRA
jgi:putative membrane protein